MNKAVGVAVGILVFVAVICGIYFGFIKRTDQSATVAEVSWQRSIQVEELKPVEKEGYDLPNGATILNQQEKFDRWDLVLLETRHPTREIPEGWDLKKDGELDLPKPPADTFPSLEAVPEDRQKSGQFKVYKVNNRFTNSNGMMEWEVEVFEPKAVNKTWYKYRIHEWKVTDTLKAAAKDGTPVWPEFGQISDVRRQGRKTESYEVVFETSNGNRHQKAFDNEMSWSGFTVGRSVVLSFNAVGHFVIK